MEEEQVIDLEAEEPVIDIETKPYTYLYRCASENKWQDVLNFCDSRREFVYAPLSVGGDTCLHMAVDQPKDLEKLLKLVENVDVPLPKLRNSAKNTPLHEAAAVGNFDAVKLLVTRFRELIREKNLLNQTPIYRAANYGNKNVVKYLFTCIKNESITKEELDYQCFGSLDEKSSILHAAIRGQHPGMALWIMEHIARRHPEMRLSACKDGEGRTCLQLLAGMPCLFESGSSMGKLKKLLYYCIPITMSTDSDEDYPQGRVFTGCRWIDIIRTKKEHRMAVKLTQLLAAVDLSWKSSNLPEGLGNGGEKSRALHAELQITGNEVIEAKRWEPASTSEQHSSLTPLVLATGNAVIEIKHKEPASANEQQSSLTPLLLAARNGIIEIVKEILTKYPQAIEHVNADDFNILHVAIQHRQRDIFKYIKKCKTAMMKRLALQVDKDCNTVLHKVAVIEFSREESKPNPALHMQDEMRWFELVKEEMQPHYRVIRNKEGKTAQEYFEETHKKQLTDAKEWCKDTCQSCSTVAALIATIVFAAAYTVPGGYKENQGVPIFLNATFFRIFTVMDVVALATSLTSLVLFLSILTSPYKYKNFHISIPGRLMFGFSFLLISVASSMVAFTATILLTVDLKKNWTRSLLYFVGFLPVSIFVLVHFPLLAGFQMTWKETRKALKHLIPGFLRPSCFLPFCQKIEDPKTQWGFE